MTESSESQSYGNFDSEWLDEEKKLGRYPTIIFHDPDNKVLIVTTSDSNTYTIKTKHGLEK